MDTSPPEGNSKQTGKEQDASNAKTDKIEALIATLVKINQSNRKTDNAEYKRTDRREKRNFWLHIVEIALITVYAFVTVLEWRTFDSERKTMENEFLAGQTNATQQLTALQGQLGEMKSTREFDERAWVFVTIPNNALDISGTNVLITITDKNIGKTPAVITYTYGSIAIEPKQIPSHDPNGNNTSMVLIPNQEGKVVITLPSVAIQAILQNVKFYIYGTVFYRDINQKNHWSQFCFSLLQNGGIMQTENFHGSCDDLENNQTN